MNGEKLGLKILGNSPSLKTFYILKPFGILKIKLYLNVTWGQRC